jgi:exopolyphosphatase/guanosine-5'-triphosphate,3'-diphosphate pyrophosphatase
MSLPREKRMIVSKLAAILRVADALDRAHAAKIREFSTEHRDEELIINVPGIADLTLERRALKDKADMFEDVFGMRIRIEETPGSAKQERRAKPVE